MALTATVHHFEIALSDVDRSVYETLDLRVAQHPSETPRWMVTRTLAYALSYGEGIAFSKGGLSDTEEPPISIRDATGRLTAWIDVGTPSAERLHKASKLARVEVYTTDPAQLARLTVAHTIHKADAIDVWILETAFVDALAARVDRRTRLELTRTEGALYAVIVGMGVALESTIRRSSLAMLGS